MPPPPKHSQVDKVVKSGSQEHCLKEKEYPTHQFQGLDWTCNNLHKANLPNHLNRKASVNRVYLYVYSIFQTSNAN